MRLGSERMKVSGREGSEDMIYTGNSAVVGDIKSSAENVAASLLYTPEDKYILDNKDLMLTSGSAEVDWFIAPQVVPYMVSVYLLAFTVVSNAVLLQRETEHRASLDELSKLMSYLDDNYISQHADSGHSVRSCSHATTTSIQPP